MNTNNPQLIWTNRAVAAAAGNAFSLFITNDGALWAMGDNSFGQLGLGAGIPGTIIPVKVTTNVAVVAAGLQHSLFIKDDGTLWGSGLNEEGELGIGNSLSTNQPAFSSSNVAAVAAGGYHSLFIKTDGSLWGMGDNAAGQLGLGPSVTATNLPTLVAGNVIAIAAGSQHSVFEKADASVWTMGNNASGQLGDGTYDNSFVPESITPPGFTIAGIASGPAASHTLMAGAPLPPAITQPTNQSPPIGGTIIFSAPATGWGTFSYQWYKNGAALMGATNSALIIANAQVNNSGLYYAVVTNSIGIAISLPAMAVVSTPALLSAGDNSRAELALGNTIPNLVNAATGTTNSAIFAAAGGYFTLFIDGRGVLWGVGANSSGQLGLGSNSATSLQAVPIASNVVAASAGMATTLFVKNDGSLWAVGDNGNYEFGLGAGLFSNTNRPQALTNFSSTAVAVSAGGSHCLVLKSDGSLWGAGLNSSGQLGLGSAPYATTWTLVTKGVASVSAGWFHSTFVKVDGSLWAMGDNSHGEMGDGTETGRITPFYVTNNVAAVAAGYNDTLFVKNDGTLWGIGYNTYGQLGNGTLLDTNRPVLVTSNVASVSAGEVHTLFLKTNGTLWVTGVNGSGQLGLGASFAYTNQPAQVLAGTPIAGAFSGGNAIHTLLVAPPSLPVITLQPSNQVLVAGNDALFTVLASGYAPLAYQWQFDGANIQGANGSSFAALSVNAADVGSYDAVIVNPGGAVTSAIVKLNLSVAPAITNISLLTNHTVKLICASNNLTSTGRIVATTNLQTPLTNWLTLTNLPAGPAAPFQFIDFNATNYPWRFYRTVWP